jgi:bifunctional non-homologous end joining protein LigD
MSRVRGARKAAVPGYVEPCDPKLREHAPRGAIGNSRSTPTGTGPNSMSGRSTRKVYSRTGLDWTDQFSSIAAAAPELVTEKGVQR